MTYFLIRVSVFFITYSFAQVVTHTEEFDDGGLKSITYYKKIGNKTTIYKEEKFYEDGSLWYSCEFKRTFDKKDWKYIKIRHGKFLSFHSNGSEKEKIGLLIDFLWTNYSIKRTLWPYIIEDPVLYTDEETGEVSYMITSKILKNLQDYELYLNQ